MNISFGASFIHNVNILENKGNSFRPRSIPFVELDINDSNDKKVIDKINKKWNTNITNIMNEIIDEEIGKNTKIHVYAVTTQTDSFQKLKDKQICGTAMLLETPKLNELVTLQTKPSLITKDNSYVPRKGIGSAIIRRLQEMYKDKPMFLYSVEESTGFYEKLGFKREGPDSHYIWTA